MQSFATPADLLIAIQKQSAPEVRFHLNHKNAAGKSVNGSAVVKGLPAQHSVSFFAGTSTTAVQYASFDRFTGDVNVAPAAGSAWRCVISSVDTPTFRSQYNGKKCELHYFCGIEPFRRSYDVVAATWQPFWTVTKVVLPSVASAVPLVSNNNNAANNANNRNMGQTMISRNEETLGKYGVAWMELSKFLDDAIEKILKPPSQWKLHYTQAFDSPESWKSFVYFKVQEYTKNLPQPRELLPYAKAWCETALHVKSTAEEDVTIDEKYKRFHAACRSTNTLCKFTALVFSLIDGRMSEQEKLSSVINLTLKQVLYGNKELTANVEYALLIQRAEQLRASCTDSSFRLDIDICDVLNEARKAEASNPSNSDTNTQSVVKSIRNGFVNYLEKSIPQFRKDFLQPFLAGQMQADQLLARWAQMISTDKAVAAKLNLNYYDLAAAKVKEQMGHANILKSLLQSELKQVLEDLRQQPPQMYVNFQLGEHIDGAMFRTLMTLSSMFGATGVKAVQETLLPVIELLFRGIQLTTDEQTIKVEDAIAAADSYRYHVEKFLQLESFLQRLTDHSGAPSTVSATWLAIDSMLRTSIGPQGGAAAPPLLYDAKGALVELNKAWTSCLRAQFQANSNAVRAIAVYIDEICTKEAIVDRFHALKEGTMQLTSLVSDNELLEGELKNKFARHVLGSESGTFNEQQEIVINILKSRHGSSFTRHLEHMLTDLSKSAALRTEFTRVMENAEQDPTQKLVPSVLTQSTWPASIAGSGSTVGESIPQPLQDLRQKFEIWYCNNHKAHALKWSTNPSYVRADLRLREGVNTTKIQASAQVVGYLLGLVPSGMPDSPEASQDPLYLQVSKAKIVGKLKGRIVIAPLSKLQRQYNLLPKTKVVAEQTKVEVDNVKDSIIHAHIVRLMKNRKTLGHQDLFVETSAQLSHRFDLVNEQFKRSVEHLIEKEYLKRDENDRTTYHYLA